MASRLSDARRAFDGKDLEGAKKAHSRKEIDKWIHSRGGGRYLGDMVYGAIDGIVTTFAVVSGVAGASLSTSIVLILGFANLLGDGLSMAIGNYLGTKSEREYHQREREREAWEIDNVPHGEVEEVRQIYRKKGFRGEDLERAVKVITSDKKVWIDTMMIDELNMHVDEERSPFRAGAATFLSFLAAGFMPLAVYVLSHFLPVRNTFPIAVAATGATLFTVGSLRTYVTGKRWWLSGLEILFVGGIAAAAAYLVGFLLRGLA